MATNEAFLESILAPPKQGPLDKVGEDASGEDLLTALLLAAIGGTATSGGSPFSTSPATATTANIPSELADAVARFRVKMAIAALQQGMGQPQTLSDFIHHGPPETPSLPVDAAEVQEVASRKGTTTSRTRQKSRGEGTSAFEEAFSVALPLLVLLNQTGLGEKLGIPGMGGSRTSTPQASTIFDEGGNPMTSVSESGGSGFSLGNLLPGILSLFRG